MRFLAAAAIIVAMGAGTACAQHGSSHRGPSAPAAHGLMRHPGTGRLAGPPRSPVSRDRYSGFGAPPNGTRFRRDDGDRSHHHRVPYLGGYRTQYGYGGYGVLGWPGFINPPLRGYPDNYDDNSGQHTDSNANSVPYVDNGAGPEQYSNNGSENYDAPSYSQGSQPRRPSDAYSNEPLQSAPAIVREVAVTLIFKDGRPPEQIRNYMLTSTKLTVLDEHYREIPLEQINISATAAANQSAGIDFHVPNGSR